ncbi:hypothetical protein LPMP_230930 [Leishmania panamensis]|uniref:DUF676 domain-containing protein n=1 Tax=Leishmania panamensis TaxID=5679 RepID=A0A088RRD5_LEIPA|nr:hypothetical protein LPMP_230930 [Leishmania panamensis]AIN98543.1 hypothetical protein LPMP_230930 [Leishmania panamensis]
MLRSLFKSCVSSSSTPQDTFKRVHAGLANPPLSSSSAADSSAATLPQSRIVDPYHFIVCQHGVLGSAADFENIIVDLFVKYEVGVLDTTEMVSAAVRSEAMHAAKRGMPARGQLSGSTPPIYSTAGPEYRSSGIPPSACASLECIPGTCGTCRTVLSSPSSAPPVSGCKMSMSSSTNGYVMPSTELQEVPWTTAGARAVAAQQQHPQPAAFVRDIADGADSASGLHEVAPSSNSDNALTSEQRARRAAYKDTYRLHIEYPSNMKGRLYRSGNLQCFSPGSNEYLRTYAGTQICARRMLEEVVPALHTWLDEVESKEQQRRANWAVYARKVGTDDAARLSAEAAAPLPICLSLMAHSFGGIIQREFLYLLLVDQAEMRGSCARLFDSIVTLRQRLQRLHVTFENFLTVATPHCGAGECLWWPIYFGAWCLARMNLCQTYDELILSDVNRILQRRLLDEPHLRVLQFFRRRVLFANTHRDIFAGFGTCSLIFENVRTDHTKFIGVAPRMAHCAAAFASETMEVSRAILLRSFEESEEDEAHGPGSDGWCSTQRSAPVRARTYTLDDLISVPAPSSAAAATMEHQASHSSANKYLDTPVSVMMGNSDNSDFLTETPRPQATSSSVFGLTTSSTPGLSSYSQSPMPDSTTARRKQPSAFAASLTIGRTAPARAKATVRVENVAVPWAKLIDGGDDTPDSASGSTTSVPSTAGSLLPRPSSILSQHGGSISSLSPLSYFIHGGSGAPAWSDFRDLDDIGLMTPPRCSRRAVASLLCDPRWASEHVRNVAFAAHAEVRGWLWTSTTPQRGETSVLGESSVDVAMTAEGVMGFSDCTSLAVLASSPAAQLVISGAEADVPQYRRAPRAIAATLRQKLSWRVRAIRLKSILPSGHVACLGNWAFFGRSPSVVQAVAEEMLIIL